MLAFAILATIAFSLILIALFARVLFKGDKHHVEWYNPGSDLMMCVYIVIAMVLLYIGVWVFM